MFGGEFYRQTSGRPIGLRSTCAVARLVMKVWDDKWLARLDELKIRLEEAIRYIDDGRAVIWIQDRVEMDKDKVLQEMGDGGWRPVWPGEIQEDPGGHYGRTGGLSEV